MHILVERHRDFPRTPSEREGEVGPAQALLLVRRPGRGVSSLWVWKRKNIQVKNCLLMGSDADKWFYACGVAFLSPSEDT